MIFKIRPCFLHLLIGSLTGKLQLNCSRKKTTQNFEHVKLQLMTMSAICWPSGCMLYPKARRWTGCQTSRVGPSFLKENNEENIGGLQDFTSFLPKLAAKHLPQTIHRLPGNQVFTSQVLCLNQSI